MSFVPGMFLAMVTLLTADSSLDTGSINQGDDLLLGGQTNKNGNNLKTITAERDC
jgi:hypothetical protein